MDRWVVTAPRAAEPRSELLHSRAQMDDVTRWLRAHGESEPFGAIVWGPKGCGKSKLARIAVDEAGCVPVTVAMCDLKTRGQVEALVKSSATMADVTGMRKVIVVEDLDAADSMDMGGFLELCNLSKPSRASKSNRGKEEARSRMAGVCPIIATCRGEPRSEALGAFHCVELKRPDDVVVRRILELFAKEQRIRSKPRVNDAIVATTRGDIRAAMRALEFGRGDFVAGAPDHIRTHEQIVRGVFRGETPCDANSYDTLLLHENYLSRVPQKSFDPALAQAADAFSDWAVGVLGAEDAVATVSHAMSHMWVEKNRQPLAPASMHNKHSQISTRLNAFRQVKVAYTEHHLPDRVDTHQDTLIHLSHALRSDPSRAPDAIDRAHWEGLVRLSRKTITAADRSNFNRWYKE